MLNAKTEEIGSFAIYNGRMTDAYHSFLKSGIGKVNAAIGTTLLNQLYSPSNQL